MGYVIGIWMILNLASIPIMCIWGIFQGMTQAK
jgi:hypothetical protein